MRNYYIIFNQINWNHLKVDTDNYFFTNKDFRGMENYEIGFKINELFKLNSSGIKTHGDYLVISFSKKDLIGRIQEFYDLNINDNIIASRFDLKDNRDWSLTIARNSSKFTDEKITLIDYRPFDERYCYYDSNLMEYNHENVMQHFLKKNNFGLSLLRQSRNGEQGTFWISKLIVGKDAISSLNTCTVFPLYIYSDTPQQSFDNKPTRTPNLNITIVQQIAAGLGLGFTSEKETVGEVCYINSEEVRPEFRTSFAPIDLLDYIYAVLHSPTYREKYKEFLKIDFPRVPYPKDTTTFWRLVKLGSELRNIHLLASPVVNRHITQYPIDGDNKVTKVKWEDGKVYINDIQYFDKVPPVAWQFYIGGYQPAQKWLKDRKDRELSFDDILHYQKIIVALTETDRLMKEIDKVQIE